MPSTHLATRLPAPAARERIMQSLAMLDAILEAEWDYRYFSFDAHCGGPDFATLAGPSRQPLAKHTMKHHSTGGLVYSTDSGRMCPACRRPLAGCACDAAPVILGDGDVRVARQTKGRGGKCVTVVKGLALDAAALAALGKQLRAACGSGGTVKDGVIEVQGDHVDPVVAALEKLGHRARRAGG